MPAELEEAAQVDGLDTYRILLRIVLPLSKAVLATMVLFYAVSFWNSWFSAFLYLDRSDLFPVTVYLRNLIAGSTGGADKTGAMATYRVGDQFKATEPLTVSIMLLSSAAYPYKADWLFWSELTKRTNVTLQPTVVPGSDYNQKRSVMVSAGNAPTIIPKTY